MHGNVNEWTEDCSHLNYENAPTNGSAWTTVVTLLYSNCNRRAHRGGNFLDSEINLKSAKRRWGNQSATTAGMTDGLRVARDH